MLRLVLYLFLYPSVLATVAEESRQGSCCVTDTKYAVQIGSGKYSCGFPASDMSYTLTSEPKFSCMCSKVQNCSKDAKSEEAFTFVSSTTNKKLPLVRINDDVCDTGDDEPATSACTGTGLFYCSAGIPKVFPVSRVEDGVVDCCDCSDESALKISCDRRQCAIEREEMEREERARAEILYGGIRRIREISATSLQRFESMNAEVNSLKLEISDLLRQKATAEAELKREEEAERQDREDRKRETTLKLISILARAVSSPSSIAIVVANVALGQGEYGVNILRNALEADVDFGKYLDAGYQDKVKECLAVVDDSQESRSKDKVSSLISALSLNQAPRALLWDIVLLKMQHQHRQVVKHVRDLIQFSQDDEEAINKIVPQLEEEYHRPQTEETRRILAELSVKEGNLNSRLSQVEKYAKYDFGPNATMIHLLDKEFTKKSGEYEFKLKPFERCLQDSTDLGKYVSWGLIKDTDVIPQEINEGKNFPKPTIIMQFDQGLRCFQGTIRTTTVYMRCGQNDELLAIFEPDVCRYVYLFSSPVACLDKDVILQANESIFASVWRKVKSLVTWS